LAEAIRAAIVEDEPPARLGLRTLLAADPQIRLVAECASVDEALHQLRPAAVELLFLDVQLARRTGFDLLQALGPARPPAVVFVTAFDHHALRAFEVDAIDYLLKPFDDARFAQALLRGKERVRQHRAQRLAAQLAETLAPGAPQAARARTLTLRDGVRTTVLPEDEIDWIEAQDYYVEIHAGGVSHLHRETLRELEAKLDPGRFARIHRSAIVRLDRVRELRALPSGDAEAVLRDGTRLRVSRRHRKALRAALGG
jgi:two-component system LytT family response regulator